MTDPIPAPAAMATEYTVCALPETNINYRYFVLKVVYRSNGRWAVTDGFQSLGVDGEWSHSDHSDEWIAAHWFDLDTALRLAAAEAPKIKVNGHTVADALKMGVDR